jgi:hypothetical protein
MRLGGNQEEQQFCGGLVALYKQQRSATHAELFLAF